MRPRQRTRELGLAREIEHLHTRSIVSLELALPRRAGRWLTAKDHARRRCERDFEREDERRHPRRLLRELACEGGEGALARREVARLTQPVTQRDQRARRDGIACGRCVVVCGLGSMDQRFMVVAGEKESAVRGIFETPEESLCDRG